MKRLALALSLVLAPASAAADEDPLDEWAECVAWAPCEGDFIFAKEQRSVVRLYWSDGVDTMTGSGVLLNNAGQEPLIMTAVHLFDPQMNGSFDATEQQRVGDALYEFSQGAECGDTYDVWGSAGLGASVLEVNYDADLMLIKLGINLASDWIYYAGWKTDMDVDVAFTVHHPFGGDKQYATSGDFVAIDSDDFLLVSGWSAGIILHGSSGAPLFDAADGFVVGGLSEFQELDDDSCDDYQEILFGRFDVAYEDGFGTHLGWFDSYPGAYNEDVPPAPGLPPELNAGETLVIAYENEFFIGADFFAALGSELHVYKAQ